MGVDFPQAPKRSRTNAVKIPLFDFHNLFDNFPPHFLGYASRRDAPRSGLRGRGTEFFLKLQGLLPSLLGLGPALLIALDLELDHLGVRISRLNLFVNLKRPVEL